MRLERISHAAPIGCGCGLPTTLRTRHSPGDVLDRHRHRDGFAAIVLSGAVATLSIGSAVREERETEAAGSTGYGAERDAVVAQLAEDSRLGSAHVALPQVSPDAFARLVLTAAIRGLVAVAPPGRPVAEVLDELGGLEGEW